MASRHETRVTVAFVLFFGAISTFWCWTAAHALGATFDEPFYLFGGLHFWRRANHGILLLCGTMPLPAEWQTLPLFVACLFGADPLGDLSTWLPIARMATAGFWWLLLWSAYRLASRIHGVVAGRLAVAFVACEPILLGHAGLATADLPFTACLLTLLAVFQKRRDETSWQRRLVWPAVWFAATFLAKASALLFVPTCLAMVELQRLTSRGWRPGRSAESWKPALDSCRDLTCLALLGTLFTTLVCPRAVLGLAFQIRHNATGHGAAFLLGELRPGGFWYYFPLALTVKVGLPILLLLAILLVWRPRQLLGNAPMWAALGLLALTPLFRVQIGVRFVLPIAVLAMVAAAIALGRAWNEPLTSRRRLALGALASVVVLWSAVESVVVWPHGICFTNQLWGGTANGYRILNDSNNDWGQGLPELAAWRDARPNAPLRLRYFGNDPDLRRIPHLPVVREGVESPADFARANAGSFVAITTNDCAAGEFAEWIRPFKPCGRTMTYLIFDFRRTEPAGVAQR